MEQRVPVPRQHVHPGPAVLRFVHVFPAAAPCHSPAGVAVCRSGHPLCRRGPNHALQRTEAGRRVFSRLSRFSGQPLSLSLSPLGTCVFRQVGFPPPSQPGCTVPDVPAWFRLASRVSRPSRPSPRSSVPGSRTPSFSSRTPSFSESDPFECVRELSHGVRLRHPSLAELVALRELSRRGRVLSGRTRGRSVWRGSLTTRSSEQRLAVGSFLAGTSFFASLCR